MPFYPAKGSNKKYVLSRPLNVIGSIFIANPSSNHTLSITRTDVDFIIAVAFYKSTGVSSDYALNGTNACFGMTDEVGSAFGMAGFFNVQDKVLDVNGHCTITWSSRNTINYVCDSAFGAGVMILFCKNV